MYLNIIFEIGDECLLFIYVINVEENIVNDVLIFYCWFWIMFLLVIYRDGLYLRIKCCLNVLSFCKCRYLELGGIVM